MNSKRKGEPLKDRILEEDNEKFLKKFKKVNTKNEIFSKPKLKETKEKSFFEKISQKILILLNDKKNESDENKKKIGIIITSSILIVLIIAILYFFVYEPYQEELNNAKTMKLNELNSLFKGPLSTCSEAYTLKEKIENENNPSAVKSLDLIRPATEEWRNYHLASIKTNKDSFNRTMAVYIVEENKSIIMSEEEAKNIINENDATILSNIEFKIPDTVAVPILISRLQASGGLLSIGNLVDIYLKNDLNKTNNNTNSPNLSSCTILAILRYDESGVIESEYIKSQTTTIGNITNPNENIKSFSTDVEEVLKGSIAGGYNEAQTKSLLKNYGLKLSDFEREINLGDLESQYLLLVEVPHEKVNFVLNNMDEIILTIPTKNAPEWMINELTETYQK